MRWETPFSDIPVTSEKLEEVIRLTQKLDNPNSVHLIFE